MADAGLVVGFGQPVRGREQQAPAVFNEAAQFYAPLRRQGEVDDRPRETRLAPQASAAVGETASREPTARPTDRPAYRL